MQIALIDSLANFFQSRSYLWHASRGVPWMDECQLRPWSLSPAMMFDNSRMERARCRGWGRSAIDGGMSTQKRGDLTTCAEIGGLMWVGAIDSKKVAC